MKHHWRIRRGQGKQLTVTTSTTEAELLALSDAARSAQYWDRLMKHLGFKSDIPVVIALNLLTQPVVVDINMAKLGVQLRIRIQNQIYSLFVVY
jgi:hypothetical protein